MSEWGRLSAEGLAHWIPTRLPDAPTLPVGELLRARAEHRPDRPALYLWDGEAAEALTYRELLDAAENVAGWLAGTCAPGDRVAVWSRNCLEWIILFYGSALAGTILAPFNTAWADGEVAHALDTTKPAVVFAGEDHAGRPLGERIAADAGYRVEPLELVARLARETHRHPLPEPTQASPLLIQFTSGTTGRAKGALIDHRALMLGGWLRPFAEGADDSALLLNALPYHHIGGTSTVFMGALTMGGAFVVLDRFDPFVIARLMGLLPTPMLAGVPTMMNDLLACPELPREARIRSVTTGGTTVPPALVRELRERLGGACLIGYGQSECTIATGTLPSDPVWVVCETVGRPLPMIEMRVADRETGATLPCGQVGEIRIKGPTLMQGYWDNPQATREAFDDDGFLRTGDLGALDEEGFCRFHGRLREVIIRGGENVYPAEVENVLVEHPGVQQAAVIGVADARLGHVVGAVVQPAEGWQPTAEELREFLRPRMASFKLPVHWKFLPALPMTASGKVRKTELGGVFEQV